MYNIQFLSPIDGDVLFDTADGIASDGVLTTKITVKAPKDSHIIINGVSAIYNDGIFYADIKLYAYRNSVWARDVITGEEQTIVIYRFKDAYKTYRFAVDDVIRCFEDIYKHRDEYTSIFENPFLSIYKKLHETYGTHVQMHIYFQNDDGSFNLTMFPNKYKDEFIKNSSWLKFTFHALKDEPASPYKHASFEQVFKEGKMVEAELCRFAGNEVMSKVTSEHWADSDIYATRAFRALGYKVLDGYFLLNEDGEPYVSYYLNIEQTIHAAARDFWVDNKEDIIFVKDDIVVNNIELDKITEYLDKIKAEPFNHAFMYILIHEQYFYMDYIGYQKNYKEKVFATVKWMKDNGYRSTFLIDIAFERLDFENKP